MKRSVFKVFLSVVIGGFFFVTACENESSFWTWGDLLEEYKNLHFWHYPSETKKKVNVKSQILLTDSLAYPVEANLYIAGSYAGRKFYYDHVHLGEDIALPEAYPVKAIANGLIVYYGPASGYGELVVVLEHYLDHAVPFFVADGTYVWTNRFLSIYGHVRKSKFRNGEALTWRVGQWVKQGEVIAYINDDLHNGDGAEHLHMGIRVQSAENARKVDSAWFRGYDSNGIYGKFYTAPSEAIYANLHYYSRWHPNGTLIKARTDNKVYLLLNGQKHWIVNENVFLNLNYHWNEIVEVTDKELSCYPTGTNIDYSNLKVFQPHYSINNSLNYPFYTYWLYLNDKKYYFSSIYTLYSWGVRTLSDIYGNFANHDADNLFLDSSFAGQALLRDGTLVYTDKHNIYVISNNAHAYKIENIDVLYAMHYKKYIFWLKESNLDYLINAYANQIIDAKTISHCL